MENRITWSICSFSELSIYELYEILHLRNKVFAVEQNDVYLDVDNKDQQAYHLMGHIDGSLVAYCRMFAPSGECPSAKIGRVLVVGEYRKDGVGRLLMLQAIEAAKDELEANSIFISAQLYLQNFYQGLGFVTQGHSYLDGTIEHIDMVLESI